MADELSREEQQPAGAREYEAPAATPLGSVESMTALTDSTSIDGTDFTNPG